jgi:hypothetical protein
MHLRRLDQALVEHDRRKVIICTVIVDARQNAVGVAVRRGARLPRRLGE